MLVLSRKLGERVLVGDQVVVTVVRIGHNAVRLGIEAPPNHKIVREELLDPNGAELLIDVPLDGVSVGPIISASLAGQYVLPANDTEPIRCGDSRVDCSGVPEIGLLAELDEARPIGLRSPR